jgi:hypothetical protein
LFIVFSVELFIVLSLSFVYRIVFVFCLSYCLCLLFIVLSLSFVYRIVCWIVYRIVFVFCLSYCLLNCGFWCFLLISSNVSDFIPKKTKKIDFFLLTLSYFCIPDIFFKMLLLMVMLNYSILSHVIMDVIVRQASPNVAVKLVSQCT